MAVVSRVARVRQQDATNANWRETKVTASVQDTPAGQEVTLTVTETTGGVSPPQAPDSRIVALYPDLSSTIIRNLNSIPVNGSATFYLTDTGLADGVPRVGTVRIYLRVQQNTVPTYDLTSDGAGTAQTGFTAVVDRGWIRGTAGRIESLSNVAAGGAKVEPVAYGDDLHVRITADAASYTARALTVAVNDTTPALTGVTNSSVGPVREVTFAGVVDERFPAAVTAVGVEVTVPNAALTGLPDWITTTVTDDTIQVDPRVTAQHHFQVDASVFDISGAHELNARSTTQGGYLWVILLNARDAGVNGLTVVQTLTPGGAGDPITVSGATATAIDGTVGVSPRLDWIDPIPGGPWLKTSDITAPSTIDSDAYYFGGSSSYTLLAPNPSIGVLVAAGPSTTADDAKHWTPGEDLMIGVGLFDASVSNLITPDTDATVGSENPHVHIGRFRPDLGIAQYLDCTVNEFGQIVATTWTPLPPEGQETGTIPLLRADMLDPAADPRIWLNVIPGAVSAAWPEGTEDFFVVGHVYTNGTPYWSYTPTEVVGAFNRHSLPDIRVLA